MIASPVPVSYFCRGSVEQGEHADAGDVVRGRLGGLPVSGFKTILAATDLGASAGRAVERAAMLATRSECRLAATHVISRGSFNALHDLLAPRRSDEMESTLFGASLAQMHLMAGQVRQRYPVDMDVSVSVGSVSHRIAFYAEAIGADLLVLGAHGSDLVRDLFVGSSIERVLRQTDRPMLVVKQMPRSDYAKILVPVDFSALAQDTERLARRLAPQAELILMHAYEVPYESKLRMAGIEESCLNELREAARADAEARIGELLRRSCDADMAVQHVLVHGQAASSIVEQACLLKCDLIALGKQGLRMVEEQLLGSVTRQVLEQAQCDVLVCNRVAR